MSCAVSDCAVLITLRVRLDHHDGYKIFDRDVGWPMALPAPGEKVTLGPGLHSRPVVERVFVPDGQRVQLLFDAGPTDDVAWVETLAAAGYEEVA